MEPQRRVYDSLSTPITMIATPRCLKDARTSPRPANVLVLDQHVARDDRYHGDDADRACNPEGERCPRPTSFSVSGTTAMSGGPGRVVALTATMMVAWP